MHKLIEYICDELDELEEKVSKDHKLSMAELEYGDKLAHFKKSLLTAEAMEDADEYSNSNGRMTPRYYRDSNRNFMRTGTRGNSYARKRDSMGRYSRDDGYYMDAEGMVEQLRDLMEDAPNEQIRQEIQRLVTKVEKM